MCRISTHLIRSDKRLGTVAERTWELDKGKVIWWWYIISQLKVLDMLKKCVYISYHNIINHILLVKNAVKSN